MPDFKLTFQEEVRRLARKEVKAANEILAAQQKTIRELTKRIEALEKKQAVPVVPKADKPAEVVVPVEILDGAVRVCSLANNKEFNVPESRVQLDGEQPAPANAEPQTEATVQTEQESAESSEQEPQAEQAEATVETSEQEAAEPEAPAADAESGTPATVEVVPEDEAAEFTPSGEDEEDEYAINPAHESDKPVKRMSLLSAAVEVLKAAGPEHPMNCKEILPPLYPAQNRV